MSTEIRQINGKSGRSYDTPAGVFPSVTTILSFTKPAEERKKLEEWRQRVGIEEAERISRNSRNDGTLLHSCIEGILSLHPDKFEDVRGTFEKIATDETGANKERVSMLFNKWNEFTRRRTGAVYALESFGWNAKHGYAGAIDYYGEFDGVPSIVDWKNATKAKQEAWIQDYRLQGSAYIGIAHTCPVFAEFPNPQQFVCVVISDECDEPQVFKYSLSEITSQYWPVWESKCKYYHAHAQ